MAKEHNCRACGRSLEAGFLFFSSAMGGGIAGEAYWRPTDNRKRDATFWQKFFLKDREPSYTTTSYRCSGCGLLDLYATEKESSSA